MTREGGSTVKCGTHGQRVGAVVCRHLVEGGSGRPGFVENSSDPDDLQAWCDACERLFLEEGGMTPKFRDFTGMCIVCDFCYAGIKERASGTDA